MVLSPQEESLISVVRALPPDEAGKVLNWARQLADLAGGRTVQWSDSWTDEDLAEATAAAVRRFEDEEREDVEARRYCRWRVSWRAGDKNSSRSGALNGGLPSIRARRRGGLDHDASSESFGSHRLPAD
jgi:hypothetical protein